MRIDGILLPLSGLFHRAMKPSAHALGYFLPALRACGHGIRVFGAARVVEGRLRSDGLSRLHAVGKRGRTRAETRRRGEKEPVRHRHRVTERLALHVCPESRFPVSLSGSAPLRDILTACIRLSCWLGEVQRLQPLPGLRAGWGSVTRGCFAPRASSFNASGVGRLGLEGCSGTRPQPRCGCMGCGAWTQGRPRSSANPWAGGTQRRWRWGPGLIRFES